MRFCVIGAANLDVTGFCPDGLRLHDSNIGSVGFSCGGVGHNIAARLAALGHQVSFVTALPGGFAGSAIRADCEESSLDLSHAVETRESSCYVALHGAGGDLLAAVNDMKAVSLLTPAYVRGIADFINGFDMCVTEANLSEETLSAIAECVRVPIAADCVSAAKCARLRPLMKRLSLIKPNFCEAEALTGEKDPEAAARALLREGVRRVLITLGDRGVFAADENAAEFLAPGRRFTCQTNGAGDAFCAGACVGAARGLGARECAESGLIESERLLDSRSKGLE